MIKKNFITLVMGTIGGVMFALGLCMCLLPQWNTFQQGVVIAAVGIFELMITLIIRRKMEGKPAIRLSPKAIGAAALGLAGTLALGVGMCLVMVWNMLILGIIVGILGITMCLLLIPFCMGLK